MVIAEDLDLDVARPIDVALEDERVVAIALSASYSAPVHGTTSWGVFRH